MKKLVSILLVVAMMLTLLSGCGESNTNKTTEAPEGTTSAPKPSDGQTEEPTTEAPAVDITYPLEGNKKLTIGIQPNSNVTAVCSGYAETAIMKEWARLTGVEIEIIEATDINLLIAEEKLPDIIFGWNANNSYPGGWNAAIEDKVCQPITDYYEEFAPDFAKLLAENPEKDYAYINGELYGFPYLLESDFLTVSSGMIIRQDWLDDLGMKAPTNHEELYTVLKAFKEKKGAEYPLSMSTTQLNNNMLAAGMMASSFGFAKSDNWVKDGVVQPAYMGEEYKAAVTFFNKLYNEGLLDPNCAALKTADQISNFLNGKTGLIFGAIGSGMGTLVDSIPEGSGIKAAGIAPFKTPDGKPAMCTQYSGRIQLQGAFITTSCKDIETAVKFLNFGYTEAGQLLFNFGVEGESYQMVDGVPTYTDKVKKNPDMTLTQAMFYYTRATAGGPFMQMDMYMKQYNNKPGQAEALEAWSQATSKDYTLPALVKTTDQNTEYMDVMMDIWTYTAESFTKFVTGAMSLDQWDEYEKQCIEFGILRATEINQECYDAQYKNK